MSSRDRLPLRSAHLRPGLHLAPTLLHASAGTRADRQGTAALNQWYESTNSDALMARTQPRLIPPPGLTAQRHSIFGVTIAAAGFLELWLGVNLLTALLGLFTLASYLFVYTPLKRVSPVSTTIGAIPGAMPPLIGYAAASGRLNFEAGASLTRSCFSGNSRTSTPSPGCTAKTTRARESACCP